MSSPVSLCMYKKVSGLKKSWGFTVSLFKGTGMLIPTMIFLKDTSLLNPVTIICTIVVLVFGILSAADFKDIFKKQQKN